MEVVLPSMDMEVVEDFNYEKREKFLRVNFNFSFIKKYLIYYV